MLVLFKIPRLPRTKYKSVTVYLGICKCRLKKTLRVGITYAQLWQDHQTVGLLRCELIVSSPCTSPAISLEGSGPVIVRTSKALGGPHTHKETTRERQQTAGTRKHSYGEIFWYKLSKHLPFLCTVPLTYKGMQRIHHRWYLISGRIFFCVTNANCFQ